MRGRSSSGRREPGLKVCGPRCSALLAIAFGCATLVIVDGPRALAQQPGPSTPAASAGPASRPVKVVSVRDLLAQAIALYQQSEFDQARARLAEILGHVGREHSRTAQEAYTYLAYVHVAFGEIDAAVSAFERALAIKPDLELVGTAPKIAEAFDQARRRFRARVRALDHDPPSLRHGPPREARYGQAVQIAVEASDVSGVRSVVLSHRIAGDRGFSSVTLEKDREGRFVATIPALAVSRPGLEYYLEAWDEVGNGPGLKGSPGAPIRVRVVGGPVAAAPAGPAPWYKRWWVWAIASGVVLAAGGAGVAAYLTREENARVTFEVPSDLNPTAK